MRLSVIFATLIPISAVNTDGHISMNIDPNLNKQMTASDGSGRKFPVIVTLQRSEDFAVVRQQGVEPTLVYKSIPAFAAQLTGEQIGAIAKLPQVKLIELDEQAWALEPH
jgi:hypothetical protein